MTAEHFVALVATNMNNSKISDTDFRDFIKNTIDHVDIEDGAWKEVIDIKLKEKS